MKLQSIYALMLEEALKVPQNQNCKIVFRHSIREKIDSGVRKTVSLTNEGIELCKTFGKGPLKKIVLKTREGMQNLTRF